MTKEVQKYVDPAMFKAEEIDETKGPEVFLLSCNPDPLGSIAAAAKAYKGEFVGSLAEITDAERNYYLKEVQKSALAMPLEVVQLHFRISGVTRGFTHQMVRQRTAAYSQESTRFAVKEHVPVGLPPSLVGSDPKGYHKEWKEGFNNALEAKLGHDDESARRLTHQSADEYAFKYTNQKDRWRHKWDKAVGDIEKVYNELINDGMPAEDARGLLPTNLLTQLNYITNLRNYKDVAGVRLCTQAQFEWRDVFAKMVQAIRKYGETQEYMVPIGEVKPGVPYRHIHNGYVMAESAWQFDALADIFRPICYYKGSCQFQADFDRSCTIRDRVQEFAAKNVPSTQWGQGAWTDDEERLISIQPAEWLLDPKAAR